MIEVSEGRPNGQSTPGQTSVKTDPNRLKLIWRVIQVREDSRPEGLPCEPRNLSLPSTNPNRAPTVFANPDVVTPRLCRDSWRVTGWCLGSNSFFLKTQEGLEVEEARRVSLTWTEQSSTDLRPV